MILTSYHLCKALVACCLCLLFSQVLPVEAQDQLTTRQEIELLKKRLETLEEKLDAEEKKTKALTEEIAESKLAQIIPEKKELKSEWGLAPAASGVYQVKKGLSLGAYGEANYRNFVGDSGKKDSGDVLRLVTYLGYKFNDNIIFNSEIEFEHASTSGIGGESGTKDGEVSVEFAYLDYLFNDSVNNRTGLVLVPMGFVNEIHEPPFYHGVFRPEVEQRIIPSTWRELGTGVFGKPSAEFEYRTFLINGLRASRFSDSGIRGGRQKGNQVLFEDPAWVGRVDYMPSAVTGLTLGASAYLGNSGQDESFAGKTPDVFTQLYEAHAQYRRDNFEFRALGSWLNIDDTADLNAALGEVVGKEQYGWYVETAYNVLPLLVENTSHYLAPFIRYENYDTQSSVASGFVSDSAFEKDVITFGLTYKPIPEVVFKLDYRNINPGGTGISTDEIAFGTGFAF